MKRMEWIHIGEIVFDRPSTYLLIHLNELDEIWIAQTSGGCSFRSNAYPFSVSHISYESEIEIYFLNMTRLGQKHRPSGFFIWNTFYCVSFSSTRLMSSSLFRSDFYVNWPFHRLGGPPRPLLIRCLFSVYFGLLSFSSRYKIFLSYSFIILIKLHIIAFCLE
jgi:hypothetical protein